MKTGTQQASKLQPIIDANKEYQLASVIADIKRVTAFGNDNWNKIRRIVKDIK